MNTANGPGISADSDDAGSVNSFGGNRSHSEGGRRQRPATSTASPNPELAEEDKDAPVSGDTANFSRNGADLENLSFDNDSIIGTPLNPIVIHSGASAVGGEVEENLESYIRAYSASTAPRVVHERLIPNPHLVLPGLSPISRLIAENREEGEDMDDREDTSGLDNSMIGMSDTGGDRNGDNHSNSSFEQSMDETLEDIRALVKVEGVKLKKAKRELEEKGKLFDEEYKKDKDTLKSERELWASNLRRARAMAYVKEEIIPLNIGGTHKLVTTKATLCKTENSALAIMFSDPHKLETHKGRIFIDRNGEAFCMMISYLRNNKLPSFANKAEEEAFYHELEYWKIPLRIKPRNEKAAAEFDPRWCAITLHLEGNNSFVRKNGISFSVNQV